MKILQKLTEEARNINTDKDCIDLFEGINKKLNIINVYINSKFKNKSDMYFTDMPLNYWTRLYDNKIYVEKNLFEMYYHVIYYQSSKNDLVIPISFEDYKNNVFNLSKKINLLPSFIGEDDDFYIFDMESNNKPLEHPDINDIKSEIYNMSMMSAEDRNNLYIMDLTYNNFRICDNTIKLISMTTMVTLKSFDFDNLSKFSEEDGKDYIID